MKKILLLVGLIFIISISYGQRAGGKWKDQIAAQKAAFITSELNLTPDEAQRFWPVYNQYNNEEQAVRSNQVNDLLNAKADFDTMSDQAVSNLIDNELKYQQQDLEIRKKYNEEFKKVLPVKKVAKLYIAEQKFKIYLLQQYKAGAGK
jgi:hypothetical protein